MESETPPLAERIARLVAERGWNQETFARLAGLNRNTVRQILTRPNKRLRNQTVRAVADALGLPVNDLLQAPLAALLPRVRRAAAQPEGEALRRLYQEAAQPELRTWMDRNPERARDLSEDEVNELLSLQGVGGPLTQFGVEHFVRLIERQRELKRRIEIIAGTEYLDLVEQFIGLIFEKVAPFRNPVTPPPKGT